MFKKKTAKRLSFFDKGTRKRVKSDVDYEEFYLIDVSTLNLTRVHRSEVDKILKKNDDMSHLLLRVVNNREITTFFESQDIIDRKVEILEEALYDE